MTRQAVLLTGGASRRMGSSKAGLIVDHKPLGLRTAQILEAAGWPVTVLGRDPIAGYPLIQDAEVYAGPLAALRGFHPQAELVFVASCDMPQFHGEVASVLAEQMSEADAIVPLVDGYPQLLCAVYRARAFDEIPPDGVRMRDWLACLNVQYIEELPFPTIWLRSANTLDELRKLTEL